MRILLFVAVIWLASSVCLQAQSAKTYELKPGEIAIQVIPAPEQYRFPQFEPGNVTYRDGRSISAMLNYNLLYGEIQFIDSKGDTLSLIDEYSLNLINIGENVFYYAYGMGYLELISNYYPVKLARKQNLEIISSEVKLSSQSKASPPVGTGAMNGQFSSGSRTTGHTMIYRDLYTKKATGALQMAKKATYFLIDKNNRFYLARKPYLLKLFPRHKKVIDQYLKEEKINFKLEEDLKKLLTFCSQLTKT